MNRRLLTCGDDTAKKGCLVVQRHWFKAWKKWRVAYYSTVLQVVLQVVLRRKKSSVPFFEVHYFEHSSGQVAGLKFFPLGTL